MSANDDAGGGSQFEPMHGIQALFQMPVVALHAIVEILRRAMFGVGNSRAESWRIALCPVCRDPLWRHTRLVDRTLEERLRRPGVPPLRKVGVDYLSLLVDRPVDVRPAPIQTDVGFVDSPFWLARISVGSTCQEWKYFTLLPVALPPAVEHQRAQRG